MARMIYRVQCVGKGIKLPQCVIARIMELYPDESF